MKSCPDGYQTMRVVDCYCGWEPRLNLNDICGSTFVHCLSCGSNAVYRGCFDMVSAINLWNRTMTPLQKGWARKSDQHLVVTVRL